MIGLFGLVIAFGCDLAGNSESTDEIGSFKMAPAEDQHLNEELKKAYRTDAEKLAIRYINDRDSTQAEIPEELINFLYNGLIHLVNADHPKAQEATQKFQVHARTPASAREILVFVDTTASWIDNWREGQTETGHDRLDDLIAQYNFTLTEYNELTNVLPTAMAALSSNRPINVYAVGRLFEEVDDVEHAGADSITDGSDIKVLFFGDYLRFTLELGFGDCPSGCINRHLWHFKVYKDGSVEFDGEKGPLPDGE